MNISAARQSGFTLLEILVAFSILVMALAVIYQILSRGSGAVILSDEYTTATIIAESKLAAMSTDTSRFLNDTQGTVSGKYRWSAIIAPYETTEESDYSTGFKLYEATAMVTWDSLGKKRNVEIKTLKLLPDD